MNTSSFPVSALNFSTSILFAILLWLARDPTVSCEVALSSCVGQAVVQGDEGPVSEVAQGVQVHGVVVRHGEKQEKEEGEVEQEVEGDGEKTLKDEDTCAWMGWK